MQALETSPNIISSEINAFDFETTTDAERTQVWLWGCVLDGEWACGTDVHEFLDWLEPRAAGQILYAYNAKFDFSFINAVLDERDYPARGKQLHTGMFKSFRYARLLWPRGMVEIRDASPLFSPAPVKLEKVLKGWTDGYVKGETPLLSEPPREIKPEWIDYVKTDVLGLQSAIVKRFEIAPFEKNPPLTTSAQVKTLAGEIIQDFGRTFPSLKLPQDQELRHWYKGGFVFCNPRWQGVELENVKVFDVNSYYPSVMRDDFLPVSYPIPRRGKVNGRLFCQKLVFKFARAKPDGVPFLARSRAFTGKKLEYLADVPPNEPKELRTFHLTNLELDNLDACYDYEVEEWDGGFLFKSRQGVFKDYVEHWRELKETSKGAMREFAKLALNAPSGKWGQNPMGKSFSAYCADGLLRYAENLEEDPMRPFHLPTSIFITATARARLVKEILRIGVPNFVYCDTDSLHVLDGAPENVHPTEIGAWKHEKTYACAKYLGAKRYSGLTGDGKLQNVIAGIPHGFSSRVVNHPYKMEAGLKVPCRRMSVVPGGMAMIDRLVEI